MVSWLSWLTLCFAPKIEKAESACGWNSDWEGGVGTAYTLCSTNHAENTTSGCCRFPTCSSSPTDTGLLSEAARTWDRKYQTCLFTIQDQGGSDSMWSSKIILLTPHPWGVLGQIVVFVQDQQIRPLRSLWGAGIRLRNHLVCGQPVYVVKAAHAAEK